jgi:hypothetical protein
VVTTVISLGAMCSILMGLFAVRILMFAGRKPVFNAEEKPGPAWWIYQFGFNFLSSAVGWSIAVLYLLRFRSDPCKFSFTGADAVPIIIGLLGITGLLPRALWDISTATRKIAGLAESKE